MIPKSSALVPASPPATASVGSKTRSPASARSVAASRSRRRWEVARGNANAMKHGVFARVANQVDVACEIAVTMAAHPNLDPLLDLRLVESYCLAATSYRRALEAIQEQGMSPTLTSFAARFAQLEERQERALFERERARMAELRKGKVVDLSMYAYKPEPKQ